MIMFILLNSDEIFSFTEVFDRFSLKEMLNNIYHITKQRAYPWKMQLNLSKQSNNQGIKERQFLKKLKRN